jgi:hypothetical protein
MEKYVYLIRKQYTFRVLLKSHGTQHTVTSEGSIDPGVKDTNIRLHNRINLHFI